MCIDIADLFRFEPAHVECLFHSEVRPVTVGRAGGLMIGIIGIGTTAEFSVYIFLMLFGFLFRLKYDVCRAFAKIQACACCIQRTAMFFVEDHKGVEAVQRKFRQGIRTPGDHAIGQAMADQFCTK